MSVKGLLATLLGLDASGVPYALAVDENGYVQVSFPGYPGGGSKRNPVGNLINPVGISPTGILKNLQVDENGNLIVTTDAQIGGYTEGARVYNNANLSIPNTELTKLTYNSESYDTDDIHSTVEHTSRLTCKTAGVYAIGVSNVWEANVTGCRFELILLNNTTFIVNSIQQAIFTGAVVTAQPFSIQYELAVNDYVEVQTYHNAGVPVNIIYEDDYSPIFYMHRIGPPTS